MKKDLFILLLLFLLAGCNSNTEEATPVTGNNPGPEPGMKQAIAQFPDSLLLRENLIQYYRENNDYSMAIATTDEALKRDSNNTRLWDIKATLHFENEDTATAIKAFEKAIGIFPDPQYLMSLGVLYAETKNNKALDIADALLTDKKTGTQKEGLFIKGLYFNYTGQPQKAIGFFDKCLELNYSFMDAYREKAVALYDLAKYEEALKVLEKATTLQNAFDEGYYWMGRCYEKLQQKDNAVESYKMAVQAAQKNNDDNIDARQALERLGVK